MDCVIELMEPIQTSVGIAKTGTKSLKVTIPMEIVAYLELESGDKLDWKIDATGGRRTVIVKKVKKQ